MNINVYQLWDAIGGVDEDLIQEIQEYQTYRKKQQKKRKSILLGLSMAACMLCVFIIIQENTVQIRENKESFINKELPDVPEPAAKPSGNKKIQQGSSADKTIQKNPSEEETVKINKGTAYFNKKFGGTLQSVTKKLWLKSYDNDIFNCDSNTQYFLSYSKKQEVLYGILSIKTNYGTIEVRVCENTMIDSGYRKLSKTKINGINIAICSIGEKSDTNPNYGAIFKKSHTVYTIERNGDLSELIAALKEIISYT